MCICILVLCKHLFHLLHQVHLNCCFYWGGGGDKTQRSCKGNFFHAGELLDNGASSPDIHNSFSLTEKVVSYPSTVVSAKNWNMSFYATPYHDYCVVIVPSQRSVSCWENPTYVVLYNVWRGLISPVLWNSVSKSTRQQ